MLSPTHATRIFSAANACDHKPKANATTETAANVFVLMSTAYTVTYGVRQRISRCEFSPGVGIMFAVKTPVHRAAFQRVLFILLNILLLANGRADEVRVYEGKRELLTGLFKLNEPPQTRPKEFRPVEYPAVFIENEYLRCSVLPTLGGRLYEVYNKASKSQTFYASPYVDTYDNDFMSGHPWNLGAVEVNFPYFHHGNTYNEHWNWAMIHQSDGSAGVVLSHTSRLTMQRAVFRVLLRPGVARVDLQYRFENLNPLPWGM